MTELSADQERATIARVVRRLVPFIFICYVVAYIDRVNIGFAATELQRDLRLSDAAYGLGGGLFFLGYCLFEIPSSSAVTPGALKTASSLSLTARLPRVAAAALMASSAIRRKVVSLPPLTVTSPLSLHTA